MPIFECSLCLEKRKFTSRNALNKHIVMEHTVMREGILMQRCSFCCNVFKGYPKDRFFYLHQFQRCFYAPPVRVNLQTASTDNLSEIPGFGSCKIKRLMEQRKDKTLTMEILLTPQSLGGVGLSSKAYHKWLNHGWTKSLHINGRSLHNLWRKNSKNGINIEKATKRKYYRKKKMR